MGAKVIGECHMREHEKCVRCFISDRRLMKTSSSLFVLRF